MGISQPLSKGLRVGRWTVLYYSHRGPDRQAWYVCHCDCGTERPVKRASLVRGISTNCGCVRKEKAKLFKHALIHGQAAIRTKEYRAWRSMKQRCYSQTSPHYQGYGSRGIVVCDRWRRDFAAFFADMGCAPKGLSLDRIDNNGPYSPENCRWATAAEQTNNRRITTMVTFENQRMPLADAARLAGFDRRTLYQRLYYGVPEERLFAPLYSFRHMPRRRRQSLSLTSPTILPF